MINTIPNLRAYLQANRHVFNLSKISSLELGAHRNLLSNFVNERGLGLGDFEERVLQFFQKVGYDENVTYDNFL